MISANLSSRQSNELESQRLQYMRCNTIIDIVLVICIIVVSLSIIIYFIILVERGKSITIS